MSEYKIGQRFMSETEPELGLGILSSAENKMIKLAFLGAQSERTYGARGAPIKRVIFEVGDDVSLRNGQKIKIDSLEEHDGLIRYISEGEAYDERELSDLLSFNKPEERLFNGNTDSSELFHLRLKTSQYKKILSQSNVRGFMGGRMNLIPHQFYVASEIVKRPIPRVLLADEVGLGKTIEAGLALHHLILTERVKRALVLTPDSLVYQWFIELLRKFNLSFVAINQETHLEPETNPFSDNDFVVVNIGLLKGAEIARKFMSEVEWDLVVVDEAHQLKWSPEEISVEYKIVERIVKKTKGLLLLTATPEQLGLAGHFARLKLLDPDRFFDLKKFLEESNQYESIAIHARELAKSNTKEANTKLLDLQDLSGPGRLFFRNTRARLAKHFSFFPKRILHAYPLESKKTLNLSLEDEETIGPSFDLKLEWLTEFLREHKTQKILLITKSKTKVLCLEKLLKDRIAGLNIALFHSSLSFVARDRQAAFFADPEGAQILLCTEIGSEGRNFEFAHHLVLFDLPQFPDLLEQRIGRLDRIGQTEDINIHVPYVKTSYEEVLFQWYHYGINAFEESQKGASLVHQQLQSLIQEYLNKPELVLGVEKTLIDFLSTTKNEYSVIKHKMEEGRDVLVELNSFKEDKALSLIDEIKTMDQSNDLMNYMFSVFQELGVDIEDLEDDIYYVKPSDNMFIPHFPSLEADGKRITFNRKKALRREDVEFLTWDHPMVVGVMELILSQTIGNVSVMMRKKAGTGKTFIEAYYKLQAIAPKSMAADRFFPLTLSRVLVDSSGENFSLKFPKEEIEEKIIPADQDTLRKLKTLPKSAVQKVLQKAHEYAQNDALKIKEVYIQNMKESIEAEVDRLIKLQIKNPTVRTEEIEALKLEIKTLENCFINAEVTLDSIRVIF